MEHNEAEEKCFLLFSLTTFQVWMGFVVEEVAREEMTFIGHKDS